ncbi:uncharacterized protein [Nicotiana sylvestris]|uniref:uncharacterized protein n=1 Tax=Nicotiana sylvestris TaxID=4096 RepID=UPI00388C4020
MRGAGRKYELLMAYFSQSLSGVALEWYTRQDHSRWYTWDDLAQAFAGHFQYNIEIVPDHLSLTKIEKKPSESFRENEAPNINQNPLPTHEEKNMIEIVHKGGEPKKPSQTIMMIRSSKVKPVKKQTVEGSVNKLSRTNGEPSVVVKKGAPSDVAAKQEKSKVVVPGVANKPIVIAESSRTDPVIIKLGKEVKEEVNEAQGLTRSSRSFTPEVLRKAKTSRDNPVLVNKAVTVEEAEEFLRKMKVQDYSIVEQLRKTPAQISLLSLLIHLDEHRQALMKILNEAHVLDKISVNHLEKIANKIFEVNRVTFSDDELPVEGSEHNKAFYLTVKCEDSVITKVLVGNGSSANICPHSTLNKLKVDEERIHKNNICIRGYDGGRKDSVGDIVLELTIGPVEFTMEFQGIIQPVSLPENLGTFGLRFKPTTADVKRARRLKQKAWALPKPIPHLSRSFVKPDARKRLVTTVPSSVVDIYEELIERYNLKLNPAKCAFGVSSGKLLGFIVSQRGIESDLSKIKVIQDFPPPKNKTETVIKAQTLADHLDENPVDEEYEPLKTYFPDEEVMHIDEVEKDKKPGWKLFFDGAANMKGIGIGDVLISEMGHHYLVTAQLRFYCTKNMTEYEACILGLRLAVDVGVQEVLVLGNSDLLVHQIQGEQETQDLKLIPYRQCLQGLYQLFRSVEFRHIPRIHNEVADALATLASMLHYPNKAYVDPLHIQVRDQHAYSNMVEEELDCGHLKNKGRQHDCQEYKVVNVLAIRHPPGETREDSSKEKQFQEEDNLGSAIRHSPGEQMESNSFRGINSNVGNQPPTWRTKGSSSSFKEKTVQVREIRRPPGEQRESNSNVGNQTPT